MKNNELNYCQRLGNWDFSQIKCRTEELTKWEFYKKIKEKKIVGR